MTKVLNELIEEGYEITEEQLGILSPYITEHVNRFGRYTLDLSHKAMPIDHELQIISGPSRAPQPMKS